MKLHLGGTIAKDGWSVLNIQPGPHVDFVGSCTDLTGFDAESCDLIYASHVFEHLTHQELALCLSECYRMLAADGRLLVSVPDLDVLCRLFISPHLSVQERWHVQRILYGGQTDEYDYHKIGLTLEFLLSLAIGAGFRSYQTQDTFGLFDDTSDLVVFGAPISLNVRFDKSAD